MQSIGQTEAPAKSDSLWNIWQDEAQPDTVRSSALKQITLTYYFAASADSAGYYAKIYVEYLQSKGLKRRAAHGLRIQAAVVSLSGQHQEVITYLEQALEMFTELDDDREVSNVLSEIGITYQEAGNFRSAITYLTESLTMAEKMEEKQLIHQSLTNIAIVYEEVKDFEKSLEYFERSLAEGELEENSYMHLMTLRNIGVGLSNLGRYEDALTTLNACVKAIEGNGDIRQHPGVLHMLGEVHLNLGDTVLAKQYLKQGWQINEETEDKFWLTQNLSSLANVYVIQNDIDSADLCSQQALEIAKSINSLKLLASISELRYKIHIAKKEPWLALEMHDLIIASKDSIRVDEAQQEVIHQQYKYEYDKKKFADEKQTEIDLLEIEQERLQDQQKLIIIIFAFILVVGVLANALYRKQRRFINETNLLLTEIKLLKENVYSKVLASDNESNVLELNQQAIEKEIDGTLNQTDWSILNVIYQNPTISNKEIAEEVSLSVDGVSSSLKKMYSLFAFSNTKRSQKKLELVVAAARYSKITD